jgi:hypothetical protein
MSSHKRQRHAKCSLEKLIRQFGDPLAHSATAYWRLMAAIRASSDLLRPWVERGPTDPRDLRCIVLACARMASLEVDWRQPVEAWIPPDSSRFVQFRSLVSHLFDRFPVPHFMAPIWLCEYDKPWERDLYLHLARGQSIRSFPWPVPVRLTKAAARYFMQAPADLHPVQALRWGHVLSLGGDARLARVLSSKTILVAPTEHEAFWESVIRFLIKNAPIREEEVIAIVDFIHGQRFRAASLVRGPGAGDDPLDPEFSVQGRSLQGLRRHMTHWRSRLPPLPAPVPLPAVASWQPTPIRPYHHVDGEQVWSIEELLNSGELQAEGGIMQHCVARYIHACRRRRTSIWSMKVHDGTTRRRVLTIEVLPDSKIIHQAKGKRNAPPSEDARWLLNRWAEQEGLKYGELA